MTSWARPGAVFKDAMARAWVGAGHPIASPEVDYAPTTRPSRSAPSRHPPSLGSPGETRNRAGGSAPVTDPQPVAAGPRRGPYALVGEKPNAAVGGDPRRRDRELGYRVYADQTGGTAYTLVETHPGFTPSGTLVSSYGASTDSFDNTGFPDRLGGRHQDLEAVTSPSSTAARTCC